MELIRSTVPDLVVTDALMPVLTGDELVEQLQGDPDLRHIPIIMATAAASPLRVRKMLGLGCKAVVAKPMDEETLPRSRPRRAGVALVTRSSREWM